MKPTLTGEVWFKSQLNQFHVEYRVNTTWSNISMVSRSFQELAKSTFILLGKFSFPHRSWLTQSRWSMHPTTPAAETRAQVEREHLWPKQVTVKPKVIPSMRVFKTSNWKLDVSLVQCLATRVGRPSGPSVRTATRIVDTPFIY